MKKTSLTAMMTAYMRAYHALYDENKIFDDFLAASILPPERIHLIEEGLTGFLLQQNPELSKTKPDKKEILAQVIQMMQGPPNILSRSRYTEDHLRDNFQSIKQYIILGAGMDTFAFRHADKLRELAVFEIDHPVTQQFKKDRLIELGWDIPAGLCLLSVDFNNDKLSEILFKSPYKPDVLSLYSWLGVVMYLSMDDIRKTLQDIASSSLSGSKLIFDYLDADAFDPEKAALRTQSNIMMAKMAGEPMLTGLPPEDLEDFLDKSGFRLLEHLHPEDLNRMYFSGRSDKYYASEHTHLALAAVK